MRPSRIHELHEEHIAFTDGHAEPFVDFDYDAIDRRLAPPRQAIARQDRVPALADALRAILAWTWRANHDDERLRMRSAQLRFIAMSAVLNPDLVRNLSYADIGKHLNVSRAYVSRLALEFQDRFAVHFRRSHKEESRAKYRAHALHQHRIKKQHDDPSDLDQQPTPLDVHDPGPNDDPTPEDET